MRLLIAVLVAIGCLGTMTLGTIAVGRQDTGQAPPAVSRYQVRIRYFIDADRNRHALEFRRMVSALQSAGFVKASGLEQEELYDEPISGTAPATGIPRLLAAPYLQTVLLIPEGYSPPAADQPVLAELTLSTRLGPTRQKELFDKTRSLLRPLGWIPAPGFDHRGFTRMLGWLPAQHLESLLLASTTRDLQARRNLLLDLPLQSRFDPFATDGFILVPAEIRFQPLEAREALAEKLTKLGFEPATDEELRDGLVGIFRGRLPTRIVERVRALQGIEAVNVDRTQAVERLAPVLAVRVIPEPQGSEPPQPPEPDRAVPVNKLSVDLRKLLAELGEASGRPIRVEVLLRETPNEYEIRWQNALDELQQLMSLEGRLGPLVTGLVRPTEIPTIAQRPEVSTIRLPQMPRTADLGNDDTDANNPSVDFVPLFRHPTDPQPLEALIRHRGDGRMAVVDVDFSGYEKLVGNRLPHRTRLLDFTGERTSDLTPEPGQNGNNLGSGTRLALLLAQYQPDELLLVRIAPDAPYMLEQIVRSMEGKGWRSEATVRRETELRRDASRLSQERADLRVQRRLLLNNFEQNEEIKAAQEALQRAERDLESRERALKERQGRFLQLISQAHLLRGVQTVLIGPLWTDGHPNLPQLSSRQRYLYLHRTASGERLPDIAWIQAVPRQPGSTWQTLFRDVDKDEAWDFRSDVKAQTLKDVVWLAWRPFPRRIGNGSGRDQDGQTPVIPQLPAGAVVQVTLQWQEVHDPAWKQDWNDDVYRQPLASFRIVALRQRDPEGKLGLPSDLFTAVARSPEWVDRIDNDRRTAIYETKARFQVPEGGGRFAIRIEGSAPESILPPGANRLPNEPRAEYRPMLRVEVIDPVHRRQGQVVFELP